MRPQTILVFLREVGNTSHGSPPKRKEGRGVSSVVYPVKFVAMVCLMLASGSANRGPNQPAAAAYTRQSTSTPAKPANHKDPDQLLGSHGVLLLCYYTNVREHGSKRYYTPKRGRGAMARTSFRSTSRIRQGKQAHVYATKDRESPMHNYSDQLLESYERLAAVYDTRARERRSQGTGLA